MKIINYTIFINIYILKQCLLEMLGEVNKLSCKSCACQNFDLIKNDFFIEFTKFFVNKKGRDIVMCQHIRKIAFGSLVYSKNFSSAQRPQNLVSLLSRECQPREQGWFPSPMMIARNLQDC